MVEQIRTGPFNFRGIVCEAGYEWLSGEDGKPRLVARFVPGVGNRLYNLEQAVFLAFAQLESQSAIKAFADKYGDISSRYGLEHGAARHDGKVAFGASLGTWIQEAADMRALVALWDNIRHQRKGNLKKLIKWTEKEVAYVLETPRRVSQVTLAHAEIRTMPLAKFARPDVVKPARYALQREINVRLNDVPTIPEMVWTRDGRQRIVCAPPNLLSAMWLQFAQAVAGEFDLYSCDSCGCFFHRGPGGRRGDSTTCSNACRQRKHRPSPLKKPRKSVPRPAKKDT